MEKWIFDKQFSIWMNCLLIAMTRLMELLRDSIYSHPTHIFGHIIIVSILLLLLCIHNRQSNDANNWISILLSNPFQILRLPFIAIALILCLHKISKRKQIWFHSIDGFSASILKNSCDFMAVGCDIAWVSGKFVYLMLILCL